MAIGYGSVTSCHNSHWYNFNLTRLHNLKGLNVSIPVKTGYAGFGRFRRFRVILGGHLSKFSISVNFRTIQGNLGLESRQHCNLCAFFSTPYIHDMPTMPVHKMQRCSRLLVSRSTKTRHTKDIRDRLLVHANSLDIASAVIMIAKSIFEARLSPDCHIFITAICT